MAAKARNNVIGKDNDLVWHLPADLKFFKQTTKGHTLIMGRKTFESLGNPLPHRDSWVVTRNKDYKVEGITTFHSLQSALAETEKRQLETIFILGGGEIYRQSMTLADKMIITEVHEDFNGDGFDDLLIAGNLFEISTQLGRLDAFQGLVLLNDGEGSFYWGKSQVPAFPGAGRTLDTLQIQEKKYYIMGRNNNTPLFISKR